jgi:hypothetical protein
MPTVYKLKCFTTNYVDITAGKKTCDIRLNDRDYKENDYLTFQEGCHEEGVYVYTGNEITARISAVSTYGCLPGYVCISIQNLGVCLSDDYREGYRLQRDDLTSETRL